MKVLVYSKSDENPYLNLLYGHLSEIEEIEEILFIPVTTLNLLTLPFQLVIFRLKGFRIFHIHWMLFYIKKFGKLSYPLSSFLNILMFFMLKLLSYRVVWTVHNIVPHEKQTLDDLSISRRLSLLAKVKIVHSLNTKKEMQSMGIDTSNSIIIPIGSYGSAYPNTITDARAREILNIPQKVRVIMFFGLIRKYKGVEDLINEFKTIESKDSMLLIAGKCEDSNLNEYIKNATLSDSNIRFYNRHIDNEDIQIYFNASDIVCLPFKKVTTSSSAILAMDFGKPIIAPKIGALVDLPPNVGILYDPNQKDALKNALLSTFSSSDMLASKGKAAKRYAKSLSWTNISRKTFEVYKELV